MPSLKAIRTRIASVKSTKKITAAMKLVAGARLKRAQDAIIAARPYARRLEEIIADLACYAGGEAHPLLAQREQRRVVLLTLTSDRGLCGGFNSNLIRRTERFYNENSGRLQIDLWMVGRKGRDYFRRRDRVLRQEWPAPGGSEPALELAREVARRLTEEFLAGSIDGVYFLYNEFKSAMSQKPTVEQLLPVMPTTEEDAFGHSDFKYEPSRDELLSHLVPLYVEVELYRALLESIASELGARMASMDAATRNASEMIGHLTLEFNRARQAAITTELVEIVGGAEALKG